VTYVGRFAPSPTGPLHFGSLLTAVASFLHARRARGQWLVRIEDIDPPREVPGATDDILRTLEAFDLTWDREVRYQSRHLAEYASAANRLLASGAAFRCDCSRSSIRAAAEDSQPNRYPGTCRDRKLPPGDVAVRARVDHVPLVLEDGLQGRVETRLDLTTGDFVIVRRDGLPAYHLAVVLDDAAQGVTTVVRGADLLESTAAHLHLQRLLGLPTPAYYHLPVVVNAEGQKLSKQTGAAAVQADPRAAAVAVLRCLGANVPPEVRGAAPAELWRWAVGSWSIETLAGKKTLPLPTDDAS